jgi:hypothetical protein
VFRSILDLSFQLQLKNGGILASVNDTTEKLAPKGAIDQIGGVSRIIHAFAEADPNAKVFMAKWDIKDGFWHMDCKEGEEWNFAYVLPQPEGEPIKLVIPTLLQNGMGRITTIFLRGHGNGKGCQYKYINTEVGSLPTHKFEKYVVGDVDYATLPECAANKSRFLYMVEVYVDDFMSLVILVSQEQLQHVATAVMTGIHDVFPGDAVDSKDSISEKKLIKYEGRYATLKTLFGFDFNGTAKTMWLEAAKRERLLTILKSWMCTGKWGTAGIPFTEYESVILKLRHAFISIPAGAGLLSPCNRVFQARPSYVYLHKNKRVLHALQGCRTLLRESTREPTRC